MFRVYIGIGGVYRACAKRLYLVGLEGLFGITGSRVLLIWGFGAGCAKFSMGSVGFARTGMNRMAVLSGSVQRGSVRGSYRFRGSCWPGDAGEYRFWNIWGLKVLNTCTPPRTRGNAGEYRSIAVFVWWEGNLLSLLLRRSNKQGWGCWAADAGSTGFGTPWGLKVLKTSTPPRTCGNAGEYRSIAVFVWWEGNLLSLLLRRSNKGLGVLGRGRGGVRVLEHLGPESAENLYSSARPRQCRGIQIMCCLCMVGRKPTFASSEKQ